MDKIFFVVKRAHHATLKFARPLLAQFGLTPARFDLLYALTEDGLERTQMALRRALGVARATISEMLSALERIGLVERTRDRDKRTWLVRLTAKGLAAMNAAVEATMHSGFVPVTVDGVLACESHDVDPAFEREALDCSLRRLRDAFGDCASHSLYEEDLDLIEGCLIALDDPLGEFSPDTNLFSEQRAPSRSDG
jgi:DNA-binding MarR family transcriptional regulator